LVSAYRICEVLGSGGMGWVFVAKHTITGQEVALKVLRDDQLDVPRAVDRMMREASILAAMRHPGVPRFHECGLLADGRPWIAMELVDGISLGTRLMNSRMTPAEVTAFIEPVAAVLAVAHALGNTHRDMKPDNIFLTPRCASFPVRVIDWGIAHREHSVRYTNHDEAIGTPTYMAPEQARGGVSTGHSDVYGLGCVAYQALTGRPPFVGNTSVEVLVQHINKSAPPLAPRCPEAPIALIELVESMIAKNIEERPTAAAVETALTELRTRAGKRTSGLAPSGSSTAVTPANGMSSGVPSRITAERSPLTAPMRNPHVVVTTDE
jgi:serine/threonine protein kinase